MSEHVQTPPLKLTGVGLRAPYYQSFLHDKPNVAWVEVHSENYFAEGGEYLSLLQKIRVNYPISMHGVFLSIGSSDGINWQYVKELRELATKIEPCLISDHLSWSSFDGQYYPDLLPLPYTEEALDLVVANIIQVQDALKRQILIENISSYHSYAYSTIAECEFLAELAARSNCGILLDINNLYVNSQNLGIDPKLYLQALPANIIHEYHLAGFSEVETNSKKILIDTHNQQVHSQVWDLYQHAIAVIGKKPTIIEWDSDLPEFSILYAEAVKAETLLRASYETK